MNNEVEIISPRMIYRPFFRDFYVGLKLLRRATVVRHTSQLAKLCWS